MSKQHSKQISAKKVAANRENALKSSGPHNSSLSRFNAMRHGLLAQGITELDCPTEFRGLCSRLEAEAAPVGEVETALVRYIALCIVRLRRAAILEAEFITAELNPALTETVYPDGSNMSKLDEMFERDYGTTDASRRQTLSPAALEVNVHHESDGVASLGNPASVTTGD